MTIEEIANLVKSKVAEDFSFEIDSEATPPTLIISSKFLLPVCEVLQKNEALYFDLLECITGIDNGTESNSIEVIYHLYSIPFDQKIALKVPLEKKELPELPEIESITKLWKAADWMERETYDLVGVFFKNHPDLRRILLPNDWEGYPLRKDYKEQQYYRGIKVEY